MLRTITTLVALSALAGCISVPQESEPFESAAVREDADRIDGMTAQESVTDRDVECNDGGLTLPPGFCAERVVEVQGRIGLDALPVELRGTNGEIIVTASEGDAWTFTATVRVAALTQEMARAALGSAWSWSHEEADGTHALRAAPAQAPSLDALTARVRSTQYELALPAWLVLELDASTDNGGIVARDLALRHASLETENGQVLVSGEVVDLRARTDNGQIIASLRPAASGAIDLSTDNGQIMLKLPEDRAHGYDLSAQSENGQVVITLRDCGMRTSEDPSSGYPGSSARAACQTSAFDERSIRTSVALETENGQVVVSPLH